MVIDGATYRPLVGAAVTYGGVTATAGPDGWYRLDLGCGGTVPGGTSVVEATHPEYARVWFTSTRGLSRVDRFDFELRRP
jgi:hypothetical protein